MILVTTPTGDIGSRVLRSVLDAGRDVRIIVRDPGRLSEDVRDRAQVVEGSHADPDVISAALSGVESVFWLPPGDPGEPSAHSAYVAFSQAFSDALRSSSATHVVGVSALGRDWPKPAGLVTASLKMDDMIGETGVNYRALACASLMDNMLRQAKPIMDNSVFYQPTPGDLKLPHLAKADVARVAVNFLTDTGWRGVEDIPLYGPEDLTFEEITAIMSSALDRPIGFQEMSMDQFEGMMQAIGASVGMTSGYVEMLTAKNEGMDKVPEGASRSNTPTTFKIWCETEFRPALTPAG
ncbi:MAG: NmrA family NAD(P)-binding protein [Pseudomonadota bacterium]